MVVCIQCRISCSQTNTSLTRTATTSTKTMSLIDRKHNCTIWYSTQFSRRALYNRDCPHSNSPDQRQCYTDANKYWKNIYHSSYDYAAHCQASNEWLCILWNFLIDIHHYLRIAHLFILHKQSFMDTLQISYVVSLRRIFYIDSLLQSL